MTLFTPVLSTVYILVTSRAPCYVLVCVSRKCVRGVLTPVRTKDKWKASEAHRMVIQHRSDTSWVTVWHKPRTTAILALRQDLNCLTQNIIVVLPYEPWMKLSSFCILNCGPLGAHCDYTEMTVNMTLLNANVTVK